MTGNDRHKGAGDDRLNPRLVRVLERKVDRVKLNLLGTPFPVRKEYAEDAPEFSTQMPVVVQGFLAAAIDGAFEQARRQVRVGT